MKTFTIKIKNHIEEYRLRVKAETAVDAISYIHNKKVKMKQECGRDRKGKPKMKLMPFDPSGFEIIDFYTNGMKFEEMIGKKF